MTTLKWYVMMVLILGVAGCSTTRIDWDMARGIGTIEAYQEFLNKHPDSEFSAQAQQELEPLSYKKALDAGTAEAYSAYLVKFPRKAHAEEVRVRLRENRCQDPGMLRKFPSWIQRGDPADPQRRVSWILDNSYIGIRPGDIGRGYKATNDDPVSLLEMGWGPGHLIYYSGRGVIVGPDGTKVLVGYSCR